MMLAPLIAPGFVPGLLAGLLLWAAPAQALVSGKTGRVTISYEEPKDPAHKPILEKLKQARVLEMLRDHFNRIRLPKPLVLKVAGCDGEINAWYEPEEGTITTCYEYLAYLAEVRARVPAKAIAAGLDPSAAVVGPFLEVFVHELSHALFDLLKLPILGREEDAADQLAAYTLLQLGTAQARKAVAGVAFMYATEAKDETPKLKDYADVHGTSAQRFFNLLCLAYGKDPKAFAEAVTQKLLPEDRAEGCADEYAQVDYAYRTLLAPYVTKPQQRDGRR